MNGKARSLKIEAIGDFADLFEAITDTAHITLNLVGQLKVELLCHRIVESLIGWPTQVLPNIYYFIKA